MSSLYLARPPPDSSQRWRSHCPRNQEGSRLLFWVHLDYLNLVWLLSCAWRYGSHRELRVVYLRSYSTPNPGRSVQSDCVQLALTSVALEEAPWGPQRWNADFSRLKWYWSPIRASHERLTMSLRVDQAGNTISCYDTWAEWLALVQSGYRCTFSLSPLIL